VVKCIAFRKEEYIANKEMKCLACRQEKCLAGREENFLVVREENCIGDSIYGSKEFFSRSL